MDRETVAHARIFAWAIRVSLDASNQWENLMYSNLLVPTDGSKLSDKAVAEAIALAKALKAKITAFHASADYPMPVYTEGVSIQMMSKRDYVKQAKADAQKILDRVV